MCIAPLLLLLAGVTLMFFPKEPQISYCSKELDWAALINNVESLVTNQVYAEFEFLISVYNPNRVEAHIDKLAARLYYPPEGVDNPIHQIGEVRINNFNADAGAVSDTFATVTLTMERFLALDLAQKYARGLLTLSAVADLDFGLKMYGQKVLHMAVQQRGIEIDTASPQDMSWCNCKDGKPPHSFTTASQALSYNPFKGIFPGASSSSSGPGMKIRFVNKDGKEVDRTGKVLAIPETASTTGEAVQQAKRDTDVIFT